MAPAAKALNNSVVQIAPRCGLEGGCENEETLACGGVRYALGVDRENPRAMCVQVKSEFP